jgi:hypothetical protein
MNDMEILRRAYDHENDPRRPRDMRSWEHYAVGATRSDMRRLMDENLVTYSFMDSRLKKYKLTEKGRNLVWATTMEREFTKIPASSILEAMDLVVGHDELKKAIAFSIEKRRRAHFLLEGPPACGKSIILEGVRSAVPDAYIAFGSRTSASGLSDILFEYQPSVLLLDEADKMHADVYAVLLGLMESGEILETKSKKTRGIKLDSMVIAACNSSVKMPLEFLSRFALHPVFPEYTRDEFIEVCQGFLHRLEGCPLELARFIGQMVYDSRLGDVRRSRAVWKLMAAPTEDEVRDVIGLMLRYSPDNFNHNRRRAFQTGRQKERLL